MGRRYIFGEWTDGAAPLTVDDVRALSRLAEARKADLDTYPMDKILALLGRVKAKWADPGYPLRGALEAELPGETGFSAEMVRLGMAELQWTLDPDVLVKKVQTELGGFRGEKRWNPRTRTLESWQSLGSVLHVLSGNVFLVGVGSLVEGLLTGNVTILKMASGEKLFLPRLIESFLECDSDGVVSRSISVIDYRSSQTDVIAELKKSVDAIVVWGGEEAVKAYRNDLPARTRIIVFGPKLSLAAVTREGLAREGLDAIAEKLALEVSIWDQNACTAPQLCYVEGKEEASKLAEAVARALESRARELPAGPADTNTAVEIQKQRSVFEIAEGRGEGILRASSGNVDWTVLVGGDAAIDPSPLHRTLRLVPLATMETALAEAANIRGYLQTVGLSTGHDEGLRLAEAFLAAGAVRVVTLGGMSSGEVDDPHDGAYDLPQLVRRVFTRLDLPDGRTTFDVLTSAERRALIDERLRRLVARARRSPYYREKLGGIAIDGIDDLGKIPLLTREAMEANLPPRSEGLETRVPRGGYVSRSGGSTGEPKFSLYDGEDWEAMISHAAEVFRAAGLSPEDRIANCMLAGDLYGSFVSFDHVNCRLGAMSFAFAGRVDPALFVRLWRELGITAIQAIPAVMMPILREAKRLDPGFSLPKVMFAGTPLNKSDAEWIRDVVGARRIISVIGANDGGQIAYQCEAMEGARHHTVDDFNYIEIVDDKGEPVPAGTAGRILITSLLKTAFPLIRYELGDAGRLLTERCPCGRAGRVLEYLGRSDDGICVGLLNLHYRDFAVAVEDLPLSCLQLVIRNDARGESVLVRAETAAGGDAALGERVRDRFLERVGRLKENLDGGALTELSVEILPVGELPRNPRSGKVKAICDERR